MLVLLAALALAQVEPPKPANPARTPDPVAPPVPVPKPQDRGIGLQALADLVAQLGPSIEIVTPASADFEARRVNVRRDRLATADEALSAFMSAAASWGYGVVRDLKARDRWHVVRLDASLAAPEYDDPAKLPERDELCTLTVRLASASSNSVLNAIRPRLHPVLFRQSVAMDETLTLTDFAPTLRQVAKLIAEADKSAAAAMTPIDVTLWLVDAKASYSEAAPRELKALVGSENATIAGKARVRVSALSPSSPGNASVALTESGTPLATFSAQVSRGLIRLDGLMVRLGDKESRLLAQVDRVFLKPGDQVVVSTTGSQSIVLQAVLGK
jgi:hypothetical protein